MRDYSSRQTLTDTSVLSSPQGRHSILKESLDVLLSNNFAILSERAKVLHQTIPIEELYVHTRYH